MSKEKRDKVSLSQLAEWWAGVTRKHHDELLDAAVRQLAELDADDETQRAILAYIKVELDKSLEASVLQAAELAARGARGSDEPLH